MSVNPMRSRTSISKTRTSERKAEKSVDPCGTRVLAFTEESELNRRPSKAIVYAMRTVEKIVVKRVPLREISGPTETNANMTGTERNAIG